MVKKNVLPRPGWLSTHAAAVRIDDAVDDGKPKPGSVTPLVRLPVAVEHMRQIVG
jgi:hypothetical protein